MIAGHQLAECPAPQHTLTHEAHTILIHHRQEHIMVAGRELADMHAALEDRQRQLAQEQERCAAAFADAQKVGGVWLGSLRFSFGAALAGTLLFQLQGLPAIPHG